ncbi:MAG: MMPL family transporter [Clostridia bacterium]|nr:MMPL family transporter [Clostridia bacterium]
MQKLSQLICKHRKLVLIIALLLLIPSAIGMMATRVNYDILVYLPEDIETLQGQKILQDDFNMGAFSIVVLENMDTKDIQDLENKFREFDTVEKVIGLTDVIGTNFPVEMLPDEIRDIAYRDNDTLFLVTFSEGISSDETLETITKMREITNEQCKISGMSSVILDTRNLSNSEIAIYVMIAVALCIIILQIALDSYFAPFLLLLNIGIAILYNMGSNIFLGEISYITKAISSVLQLGVTMDFAIFLYHSYKAEKEKSQNKEQAMANAICQTATSVVGSSLTTIAGFLALCSMNLTLGKDIGIVMAKGVLFGLICVITVLPAMLLQFDKAIEKTKHKEILPKFTGIKNFNIKHHKAIIVIALIILPFAIYGYTHTGVYYNLDKSLPDDLPGVAATNVLQEKFGIVSTEVALVKNDMPTNQMTEMLNKIEEVEGIEWTLGYNKLAELGIPKEALPEEILSIFENGDYQMIVINSKYEMATDELNHQIDQINTILKEYDEKAILAGEGPLMNDLVEIADHDFNSVNIVSIAVILVIMIFVLKSASLPIILIGIIEFAIFINMGIPAYTDTILPFVASIVIGTIQLGATIDYAILITTKYVGLRKEGKDKKQAVDEALGTSISSIVTSGLCFFGATFGVGVYSEIEMIGSLCSLMSRGAIISMIVVITVLPAFLLVCDKLICKTTKGMREIRD